MRRVGIISDTHGYWDDRYAEYLGECDEIWHAGDIGSMELADRFEAMRPIFRAVCGNLFVCGHSHILKIMYDKTLRLLHINPGAAGLQGWQTERTLVRLTVDGKQFKDCEVITLGERRKVAKA